MTIVKPETLVRQHRNAFRLFWRRKSKLRGRPWLRAGLRKLIAEMAKSNPVWGEERIAAELLLKLRIQVSPPKMDEKTENLAVRMAKPLAN